MDEFKEALPFVRNRLNNLPDSDARDESPGLASRRREKLLSRILLVRGVRVVPIDLPSSSDSTVVVALDDRSATMAESELRDETQEAGWTSLGWRP